jgi:phosphatidylserine/phosphatidylglycerophosphate/cardiolipin synthase-like enzyme
VCNEPENHKTIGSVSTCSTLAESWFLREKGPNKHEHVHFPIRPDAEVAPLVCGQAFFKELATAIASAKRSVDLVSWGLDTDMVLVRSDGTKDYNLTQKYPHETFCWHTHGLCKATDGPCPYKEEAIDPLGLRISDLLACVARRGVKVRILVWEPHPVANNVIDPCLYWFRCKTKLIPNTQFAFREFKGTYTSEKPPAPKVMVQKTGAWNWVGKRINSLTGRASDELEEYEGGLLRKQEETLRKILSEPWDDSKGGLHGAAQDLVKKLLGATDNPHEALYSLLYSHHQKMALIDVDDGPGFDPEKSVGFIMGFNFKEEYWDDTQHEEISPMRLSRKREGRPGPSLGPWQDVGAKLRGSILFDMAQNMRQSWQQKNEVLPVSLIGNGVAALMPKKQVGRAWDNASFVRISKTLAKAKPMPVSFWQNDFKLWALGICAYLTGLLDLIAAVLDNKFDVGDFVQEEGDWWGNPASEQKLVPPSKIKEGWYQQPAQYLRTFSLKEPPLDLSIATATFNIVDPVRAGGLLYYENQYFRDPYLGQKIVELYKTRANNTQPQNPYTIIVTNRLTNDRERAVNAEAWFAAKPTKMVYEQLKASAGRDNILWCWLHVKKRNAINPDTPREAHAGESLITAIVKYREKWGTDGLREQHEKIGRWRDRIYYWLKNEAPPPADEVTAAPIGMMTPVTQWISALGVPMNLWLSDVFLDARNFAITRLLEIAGPAYQVSQQLSEKAGALGISPTNAWEMLVWLLDMIPEPPDNKSKGIVDRSNEIADEFEKKSRKMEGLNEEKSEEKSQAGKIEIKRLEDQRLILDELEKKASSPTEHVYVLTQRTLNNIMLWKEERLKSAEDAQSRPVKGAIYVHSKVTIVDEALAMIGSNNINERSMYHDSENAVMFRATCRESMPAELRKQLFGIMVGDGLEGELAKSVFAVFKRIARDNAGKLTTGVLEGHVVTYIPDEAPVGSPSLS